MLDAGSGRELLKFKVNPSPINAICFSPDGNRVATTGVGHLAIPGQSGTQVFPFVEVWDLASNKQLFAFKGESNDVGEDDLFGSVCFSADGRRLTAGGFGRKVKVWDSTSGKELNTLNGHRDMVYGASFSPDGKYIASGSMDMTLKLWEVENEKEIFTLKGSSKVASVCFSPNGRQLAALTADGSTVKIWDVADPQDRPLKMVAAGSSDKRAITVGPDEMVEWDLTSGHQLCGVKISAGYSEFYSPDRKRVGSIRHDPLTSQNSEWKLKVRDALSGKEFINLTFKGRVSGIFSPDGKQIALESNSDGLELRDVTSGKQHFSANVTHGAVHFTPDGRCLAASGYPKLRVWDATSGNEIFAIEAKKGVRDDHSDLFTEEWSVIYCGLRFSPDGKRLVTISSEDTDETVTVWNAVKGVEIVSFNAYSGENLVACFSPDGVRLATGGGTKTVKIWDAETGQELLALNGHKDEIDDISFSPDGTQLLSVDAGGIPMLWDATP